MMTDLTPATNDRIPEDTSCRLALHHLRIALSTSLISGRSSLPSVAPRDRPTPCSLVIESPRSSPALIVSSSRTRPRSRASWRASARAADPPCSKGTSLAPASPSSLVAIAARLGPSGYFAIRSAIEAKTSSADLTCPLASRVATPNLRNILLASLPYFCASLSSVFRVFSPPPICSRLTSERLAAKASSCRAVVETCAAAAVSLSLPVESMKSSVALATSAPTDTAARPSASMADLALPRAVSAEANDPLSTSSPMRASSSLTIIVWPPCVSARTRRTRCVA